MKTQSYNPSQIELDFSEALLALQDQLQKILPQYQLVEMKIRANKDNPDVLVKLTDSDSDKHELVINFIQKPD